MDSVNADRVLLCRVSPFGNLRIKAHLRLPEAFRSLSRPSSALSAKAFPLRPLQLDLLATDDLSSALLLQELGKISVLVISCEITEFNKNPTRFYLANFVVDLLINLPNNKTSKPFCWSKDRNHILTFPLLLLCFRYCSVFKVQLPSKNYRLGLTPIRYFFFGLPFFFHQKER